jgi:hypothetical protein
MKKLFLLFVCLPQLLWAQVDFNYVSPIKFGTYHAVAINSTGETVAVGSARSCPEALISFFDSNGHLKWQKQNLGPGLNLITDVFFDVDGNIVTVGIDNLADDFGWEDDGFFFLRLSIEGDTLNYNKKATSTSFAIREKAFIIAHSDSTYLVAQRDQVYWITQEGDIYYEQDFSLGKIIGLSSGPEDHFIVLGKKGAQLFNPSGELIQSYLSEQGPFLDLANARDTTWLLSENQLWVISDLAGEPQKIILPLGSSNAFLTTRTFKQGLILASQKENEEFFFLEYKSNQWDTLDIKPPMGTDLRDFKVFEENYYFVGTDLWERPPMRDPTYGAFLSVTSEGYKYESRPIYDLSLEPVIVEPTGPIDTLESFPEPFESYSLKRAYQATVTVRNNGLETINSFIFFSEKYGGFNCGHGSDYYYFDNLDIEAGKLYTFAIDFELRFGYLSYAPDQFYDRCFYIAAPNLKLDQEISNNSACVTLISNTQNAFTLNDKLQVFPNPASTILNIQLESSGPIEQVALFDLQGRSHEVNTSIQGASAQVARGNLPTGIYILKVFTKEGVGTKKIILK